MRVALIGGIALVAFAVIFFRLWYLQVLSGDRYLAEARDNRVREIKVQAPRGEIVDRDGRKLVDNRPAMAVVLTPDRLPEDLDERRALYRRLGKLLDMRPRAIERDVEPQLKALPYSTATVKQDVPISSPGTCSSTATTSGAPTWSACSCAPIRTTRSARTCSARSAS